MKLLPLVFLCVVSAIATGVPPLKGQIVKQRKTGKAEPKEMKRQVSAAKKAVTSSKTQESLSGFWKKGWKLARSWLPVALKVGLIAFLLRQEWISQYGPAIQVAKNLKVSPAAEIVKVSADALVAAGKQLPAVSPFAATVTSKALVAVDQATPSVPRSYGHSTARALGKRLLKDVMALTALSKENDQVSKLRNWASSFYNELLQTMNGVGRESANVRSLMKAKVDELDKIKLPPGMTEFVSALRNKFALGASDKDGQELATLLQKTNSAPSEELMNSFANKMWDKSVPGVGGDAPELESVHALLTGVITKIKDNAMKIRSFQDIGGLNLRLDDAIFFEHKYVTILSSLRKAVENLQIELVANAQYPWRDYLQETLQVAQKDISNLNKTPLGSRLHYFSDNVSSGLAQVAAFIGNPLQYKLPRR
jgi:hypothetical protein